MAYGGYLQPHMFLPHALFMLAASLELSTPVTELGMLCPPCLYGPGGVVLLANVSLPALRFFFLSVEEVSSNFKYFFS